MHEGFVGRTTVIAICLWVLVAGLMLAAWLVITLAGGDSWKIGGMLAASACATSAIAAAFQIRVYMLRTCALIRAIGTAASTALGSAEVRPIR